MRRHWIAGMVLAASTVVLAGDSLVQNGGFESPAATQASSPPAAEKWLPFSKDMDAVNFSLVTHMVQAGRQAARVASNKVANSFHGIGQVIAVQPGATYRFTVQVRNDPAAKMQGSTRGQISIEWQDSSGKEIDRTWGPDFGPALSDAKWSEFQMTGKAPAGAVRAHCVITMHEGQQPGGGALLVDEATARQMP